MVCKERKGGGLAIGVHKDVYSVALNEGDDNVECFSVEISIKDINIRLCNAYGPQEADSIERKQNFWEFLDREVDAAEENNSGFLLQFDGNLWAGEEIIEGDVRKQNYHGRLFQEFLKRHSHLTVVNSLPLCEGKITRVEFMKINQKSQQLTFSWCVTGC